MADFLFSNTERHECSDSTQRLSVEGLFEDRDDDGDLWSGFESTWPNATNVKIPSFPVWVFITDRQMTECASCDWLVRWLYWNSWVISPWNTQIKDIHDCPLPRFFEILQSCLRVVHHSPIQPVWNDPLFRIVTKTNRLLWRFFRRDINESILFDQEARV